MENSNYKENHYGGTRKIADLKPICRHPEHDPAKMKAWEPGVYEHVCPGCGAIQHFTISRVES